MNIFNNVGATTVLKNKPQKRRHLAMRLRPNERLRPNKDSKQKYHNLKLVTRIKILGIHFRNDINAHFIEDNWSQKMTHGRNNSANVKKKTQHLWKSTQC